MKAKAILFTGCFLLITSLSMAAQPIKIGFVYILSGRLAGHGMVSKKGAELAIEEINRAGGINGRKIVAIFEDTKLTPKVTVKAIEKLVKKDRVDVVMGIVSSKVAANVVPQMRKLKTPLIITTAQTPVVTGSKCNPYTFRVTWSTDQNIRAAAIVAQGLKSKKWTTIGPAYALGFESWALFKKYLKVRRPDNSFLQDSQVAFAPLSNKDWAPQIKKVMDSGADGVLISLWGGNFVDFVKQANKKGFFDGTRECITTVVAVSEFLQLGLEMPSGLSFVGPYWHTAQYRNLNSNFAKMYENRYGLPPLYHGQFAYSAVKVHADTAQKLGGTDKEAIVKALEGASFQTPVGPLTIRAGDHQALFDAVAGTVSKKLTFTVRKHYYRKLDPIVLLPAVEVATPLAETGCNMR